MTDSPDKIQWHPAFCAAAGLELQEKYRRFGINSGVQLKQRAHSD